MRAGQPSVRSWVMSPHPAWPARLLQWTATSRGSRNRTCLVVLRGSAPWLWRSCGLRLRIEGGPFLSSSWGVGSRGRQAGVSRSCPAPPRLETGSPCGVPAVSSGFMQQGPDRGVETLCGPAPAPAWPSDPLGLLPSGQGWDKATGTGHNWMAVLAGTGAVRDHAGLCLPPWLCPHPSRRGPHHFSMSVTVTAVVAGIPRGLTAFTSELYTRNLPAPRGALPGGLLCPGEALPELSAL